MLHLTTQYYNDRIQKLFQDLLVCNPPEDLLYDVKSSFDAFIFIK